MQAKRADALRRLWGNKPCDHPRVEREYYLSADTGDYVCTQCGESFTRAEKEQLGASRAEK